MDATLDDAFRRVDRAGKRVKEVEGEIAAYRQAYEGHTFIKVAEEGVSFQVPAAPPPEISVTIGEVVYNLRAALDYLVYELAILDSGKVVDGTQFPIVKKPEDFKGVRRKFLRGLTDDHVAAIERLQPYKRPHWLWALRALSNEDKHRTLSLIGYVGEVRVLGLGATEEEAAALGGYRMPGDEVSMYYPAPILISFIDRTPIEESLQQFLTETRKVLEAFDPEFKPPTPGRRFL